MSENMQQQQQSTTKIQKYKHSVYGWVTWDSETQIATYHDSYDKPYMTHEWSQNTVDYFIKTGTWKTFEENEPNNT